MYQELGQDPLMWLEQGQFLRLSAKVILDELAKIWTEPQSKAGVRQRKLAWVQGYMMLSAMAIENVIKGIIIMGDPGKVTRDGVDNILRKGGHGIVDGATSLTTIDAEE